MLRPVISFLAVMVLIGLPVIAQADQQSFSVIEAYANETPATAKVGAVFLKIKANDPSLTGKVISAKTDIAERVELHTHTHDDGVMRMRQVQGFDIPKGEVLTLKPMGDHIMLFGLKKPLVAGESFDLDIYFEKADYVSVPVEVRSFGQ